MNFSFIEDPRWNDLDEKGRDKMLSNAFEKGIVSDNRWGDLSIDVQESMRGAYLSKAREYEQSLKPVSEHGFIGETAAGLGRGLLHVAATPAYLADVAGEAIGWEGLEKAGERGAEKVEKFIEESPKLRKSASISGDIRKNPQLWTNPNWYASIVSEGIPTVFSMLVPGMGAARGAQALGWGAGGVRAARVAGGLSAAMGLEAGGAAEQARQYEKTGENIPIGKKLQAVVGTGLVAGSLEYVPIFTIFGRAGGRNLVKRVLTAMATEGSTEGAQEVVANAFSKIGYDADTDMTQGVIESIVGGVLIGGGMGGISGPVRTFQEQVETSTTPESIERISKTIESGEKEAVGGIIDRGFLSGKLNGQPFTADHATSLIQQGYLDEIFNDEDVNQFKEKYPELRERLEGKSSVENIGKAKTVDEAIAAFEQATASAEEVYGAAKKRVGLLTPQEQAEKDYGAYQPPNWQVMREGEGVAVMAKGRPEPTSIFELQEGVRRRQAESAAKEKELALQRTALPPGQGFEYAEPKPETRLRKAPETYPEGAEYVVGKPAPEGLGVEHKPILRPSGIPWKTMVTAESALKGSERLKKMGVSVRTHKTVEAPDGGYQIVRYDDEGMVAKKEVKEKVKGKTLLSFIRAMGGIRDASLPGEVRALSGKETGVVGLTTKRTDKGLAFDEMASAAVEHGWLPENLENQSGAFSKLLRGDIFAQKEGKQKAERQEDIAEKVGREERWDEFERSEDEELEYFAKHPDEVVGSDLDQWQREAVEEIRSRNDARTAREIEESVKGEVESEDKRLGEVQKDEDFGAFTKAWDESDYLDDDAIAELAGWRVIQKGEGIAVMAKEGVKEPKPIETKYRKRLEELKSEMGEKAYFEEELKELYKGEPQEILDVYRKLHPESAGVLYQKEGDRGVTISPSAKEPGMWQTTWFDSRGFSGDTSYKTEAEAFAESYREGYRLPDPARGRKQMVSPEFIEGIDKVEKARKAWNEKSKEISEKVKAETPGMLKESDKVNDVTLGTLVNMASEDPAKALEHAAEATVSKTKLIEGLKNKGLKAMGEAKTKEERAEIKRNLEETLRGIEEGKKSAGMTEEQASVIQDAISTHQNYLNRGGETSLVLEEAIGRKIIPGKLAKPILDRIVKLERQNKLGPVGEERTVLVKKIHEQLDDLFYKKPKEPVVEVPAKEPWEMGKEELRKQFVKESMVEGVTYETGAFAEYHERQVKRALKSGKLTPENYTELHAKDYGPLSEFMPGVEKKPESEVMPKVEKPLSFDDWAANQPAGERNQWIRTRLNEQDIPLKPTSVRGKIKYQNAARKAAKEFDEIFEKRYQIYLEKSKPEKELLSETKSRLLENIKSEKGSSELINDLSRLGADAIKRGHRSFKAFSVEMRAILGDAWAKVKHLMRRAYADAKLMMANERGLIGGVKAKGAPTGQLAKAQELLAEGKDKNEVWRETGWLKGVEKGNVWKFEIDDSGARLKSIKVDSLGIAEKYSILENVLHHSKLFRSYPKLANILTTVMIDSEMTIPRGEHILGRGRSGEGLFDLEPEIRIYAKDIVEAKGTLLHEIQHAIQTIEGFAPGGSPKAMAQKLVNEETNYLLKTNDTYADLAGYIDELYFKGKGCSALTVRMYRSQMQEILDKHLDKKYGEDPALNLYKRLAGEIEARDTTARAKLTAKQRREQMPYGSQGIPQDQWIVTEGKGTSFSVEASTKAENEKLVQDLNDKLAEQFKDKEWENAYNAATEHITGDGTIAKIVHTMGQTFKVNIVPIKANAEKFSVFGGQYYKGTLFVDTSAAKGFVQLSGHELLHHIKQVKPDLYEALVLAARDVYKDFGEFKKAHSKLLRPGEELTTEQLEEELIADFVGDALADPKFLKYMAGENPSIFKQLMRVVIDWLNDVSIKMSKEGFGSSKYFSDVNKLREYLDVVLHDFAKRNDVSTIDDTIPPKFSRIKEAGDLDAWAKSVIADVTKADKAYAGVESDRTFQETLEPVTAEDYVSNREINSDTRLAAKTNARRVASEIAEGVDKFLGSISTRLGQVSPKLKAKMRRLDFDINTKYADDVKTIHPLLKKAKKMNRNDFADWDYARKNSDIEKINELISKYGMKKEYAVYRETLDRLRKEGFDVGLIVGEIEEYAPRILKDSRGFLTAIGKAEEWPVYSRRLQERANDLGVSVSEMTPDMKADIISNMILGGWSGLGGIPATKHRILKKIPADLNKYYMDSDGALMQHLYSMRKGIEARKFFGKIPKKISEMRKRLHATQSKIRKLNSQLRKDLSEVDTEKLKKKRNKYIGLEKQYSAYIAKYALQRDYTENIGSYVMELIDKKEISPQHERMVNDILNARFHEAGTRGLIQAYKNLSYIDTMGSPISALTQIGDLAWAAYEGGFIRAGKYAYKAAIGKSRITKEDVGVTRIAQEFADSGTLGDAVTKTFKIVGLEKIDSIGKESLLNSALEVYQKQAKTQPTKLKKQIRPIFEGETDSVIDDLVNDEITENVKLLVYSRLLDFQPVALSEMPQRYLDAGNGRLFYMLKTFTIKVFDVFRNESYNKIKTGNKAEKIQGIKNLIRLSMIFILANATADELKDWVLGRKTDFSDRATDNILRLFGISKFVTWKARTEGVGSALARQVLPPFKFIDSAGKDIITAGDEKGLEVIGSIPVVGKLAYWHMGRGTSKREDLWNRRLRKRKAKLNKVKDGLEKSDNKGVFRRKHRKELNELQLVNGLQGRLNKYRKRINRLKGMKETLARKKLIQKLENQRTELIKKFLNK